MSGDIIITWGSTVGLMGIETRDAAKHSTTMQRASSHSKESSSPNLIKLKLKNFNVGKL